MKTDVSFAELFNRQVENQKILISKGAYDGFSTADVPEIKDDAKLASYNILQLVSEVGEVLSADKRWKNCRNDKLDIENKGEEIADCFIVLFNIAMYSGMSPEFLQDCIVSKMEEVKMRFEML